MSNAVDRWFEKRSLTPLREFTQIQDSFDRLFNNFMDLKKTEGLQPLSFSPSCEIVEDDKSYSLKFDIPGVSKDQVKLEIDKDRLTVRAERKEEKKSETKKKYLSEMYYGSYVRSFTLPTTIDEKAVEAKFENGVLTVTIPKTESVKAKQIAIQ